MLRKKWLLVPVVVHALLLAAYTLPERFVPEWTAAVALRYVRPLFHQQWHLFAPDPPMCSCELEYQRSAGPWQLLSKGSNDPLRHRMRRRLAEYVQEGVHGGGDRPITILQEALYAMVLATDQDTANIHFRLVERCVADPSSPIDRTVRITPLEMGPS